MPDSVDAAAVRSYLAGLPGVAEVHDLHIWALSTTEIALTAHLVRPGAGLDDTMLHATCETLRERFRIGHATLQVEDGSGVDGCALAPEHVV